MTSLSYHSSNLSLTEFETMRLLLVLKKDFKYAEGYQKKTPGRRHRGRSGVSVANFQYIYIYIYLVPFFYSFHC